MPFGECEDGWMPGVSEGKEMDLNWAPKYHHCVSLSNDITARVTPIFRMNNKEQHPTYILGIKAGISAMLGKPSIT